MKMRKIMLVIPTNTSGGAERVLCQLANYFAKKDIEVTFVNFDSESNFYTLNQNVNYVKLQTEFKSKKKIYKVLEAPVREIQRFAKINSLINKFKPDVVLPFCEMAEVLTIPNCLIQKVPFCISVRNDYSEYYWYMKMLSKLTYSKAKLVVCQTKAVEKMLLESVRCNTTVIYNPLDETTYDKTLDTIFERKHTFINVGRLTQQKNQKLLIKAFAKVSEAYPDYCLYIYGRGELREELQDLIRDLHMEDRVLLKGVLNNAIKENRYATAFVMSSDFEGFPNTLVEAMANGIPSISTDFSTRAAKQLLKDGDCGWLVDVGNEEQLAAAMINIIENPAMAQEKASKGLYVREYLATDAVCQQWIDEIERTL